MTVVGPDDFRSICLQISLKLKRSPFAIIANLTVSKALVPILQSPHNYPDEFAQFVLAVIIEREMARTQGQRNHEENNMEIDNDMTNNEGMVAGDGDEIPDDQMQSIQDFMSIEDLVDDFFNSLSMSENAVAHINSLTISETAAASASTTANDEMAWEAPSGSSSQRSASSSMPPSFNYRNNSPLPSVATTRISLFTPHSRERSLSIPSSNQTSSSRDSCMGIKRKSPDNASTLSPRPEKRICCDENWNEEMELD